MLKKKRFKRKPKFVKCLFCEEKTLPDYKEPQILKRFITERGKMLSRANNGVCSKHQRKLTREIKRARHLALLPFITQI